MCFSSFIKSWPPSRTYKRCLLFSISKCPFIHTILSCGACYRLPAFNFFQSICNVSFRPLTFLVQFWHCYVRKSKSEKGCPYKFYFQVLCCLANKYMIKSEKGSPNTFYFQVLCLANKYMIKSEKGIPNAFYFQVLCCLANKYIIKSEKGS